MLPLSPLSTAELGAASATLPGWAFDASRNALFRKLTFADFPTAIDFMVCAAHKAEAADHHPEWTNVHHVIEIWLTTHDAGGVTDRDVALAREFNRLLETEVFAPASTSKRTRLT